MPDDIMQKEIEDTFNYLNETLNLEHIITEYQKAEHIYEAGIKEIRTKLEILDAEFKVKHDHNPIHHMEYRLKSIDSIASKLVKNGYEFSIDSMKKNLKDIAGVRVICNYIQDIYQIVEMLQRQDDIETVEIKDYIKNPKPSGYRSLHLVVKLPIFLGNETTKVYVEIQIRTIAMDFWASLEHSLHYKNATHIDESTKQRLTNCANMAFALDREMEAIYNLIDNLEDKS